MKRTLFITNNYHLNTRDHQLVISDKISDEIRTVPIEDIGYIVFEHPQITFTQSVIQLLAENNTAVIFCDQKYHPSSMLLHLDTHYIQTERFRKQTEAALPFKKQLWKQTVQQKIVNQAALLTKRGINANPLNTKIDRVKSGDTTNEEAKAARIYWQKLFGPDFKRDRYGDEPNPALNYGYAILRAATARALAASGLLVTLGIHHRNKYNSFCLADDVMEPYRPFVDELVINMYESGMNCMELGKQEKMALLEIPTIQTLRNGQKKPISSALTETCSSLAHCFEGEQRKLIYPILK